MSEKKENKHIILKTACGTLAAGTAAYSGYAYLLFRNAFVTDRSRFHPDGVNPSSDEAAVNSDWFKKAEKHDETIRSFDGLSLHAMRIENHPDSDRWMILMHGYHRTAYDLLHLMREADARGFNLLAVDQRGSGKSEGKYCGLGWPEHYDLLSWINFLSVLRPQSKIVLYGIDMGANAVMNAVGDFLSKNIVCAVEEGGWSDIKKQFLYTAMKETNLPVKPFYPAVDLLVRHYLSYSMNEVSTLRQLSRCTVPMLFMHGADDEIVPLVNVEECSREVHSETQMMIFSHTGFGGCRYNENYYDVIFSFAEKYL